MVKYPMGWHRNCLDNMLFSLDREEMQLKNIQDGIYDLKNRIGIYKAQIQRAEKEGKEGFDRDIYNIKRKKITK